MGQRPEATRPRVRSRADAGESDARNLRPQAGGRRPYSPATRITSGTKLESKGVPTPPRSLLAKRACGEDEATQGGLASEAGAAPLSAMPPVAEDNPDGDSPPMVEDHPSGDAVPTETPGLNPRARRGRGDAGRPHQRSWGRPDVSVAPRWPKTTTRQGPPGGRRPPRRRCHAR